MYAQVLLIACFVAYALVVSAQHYALEDADSLFEEFVVKFNKQYVDDLEKASRYEIFKANLEKTNNLNKDSENAVFGISKFMDLTLEEFLENNTGLRINASLFESELCDKILYDNDIPDAQAPESLDWRSQGAVTAVKNQGTCGSCFAFSAVGNVEGQQFMKTKQLLILSEQQVLDCNPNGSCQGGFMSEALRTLAQLGGSISESDYPYKGQKGQCKSNAARIVTKVKSCISFSLTSQEKLKQLLYQNGPIAIGIKADALHTYHGGILPEVKCKRGQLNHAVLLVGYGIDQGEPYWLVKNSWDSQWAEEGYFRMGRSNDPEGACGALNEFMATAVVSA